jgi:hypothetical protein
LGTKAVQAWIGAIVEAVSGTVCGGASFASNVARLKAKVNNRDFFIGVVKGHA